MPDGFADLAGGQLYGGLLVFCRVGAALMLLPGFGEAHLPPRIRLAVALLVTLALAGSVPDRPEAVPSSTAALAGEVGAECIVGIMLGATARFFLLALHVTGTLIAQQAGLGMITPSAITPEVGTVIAHLLMLGAVNLIFAFDLDQQLLFALRNSYLLLPIGQLPEPGDMARHMTETMSAAFALGVRLSLPFLVIGFTVYAGLGVINRAMPQMMVFFVAAPGLTMIGLILLGIALPTMLLSWAGTFEARIFAR